MLIGEQAFEVFLDGCGIDKRLTGDTPLGVEGHATTHLVRYNDVAVSFDSCADVFPDVSSVSMLKTSAVTAC